MNHRLDHLSTEDVAALDKKTTVIVQPIGAMEQHGPHLPVVTDALVAERLASAAAAAVSSETSVWTLPTLTYGKSTEHLGWAGTVSLSSKTLLDVCLDVGRSVAASGFTRLVFVNGHGGNPSLLDVAARDIRSETGLLVFPVTTGRLGHPETIDIPDHEYSIHGGHVETSVMLALAPELVKMERAVIGGKGLPDMFPASGELTLEGALPTAWLSGDLTKNGVIGDPLSANASVGAQIVEHWTSRLSAVFREISQFEFTAS